MRPVIFLIKKSLRPVIYGVQKSICPAASWPAPFPTNFANSLRPGKLVYLKFLFQPFVFADWTIRNLWSERLNFIFILQQGHFSLEKLYQTNDIFPDTVRTIAKMVVSVYRKVMKFRNSFKILGRMQDSLIQRSKMTNLIANISSISGIGS